MVRIEGLRLGKELRRVAVLILVSMSLHLLSISSESLRSEERILPRCKTVLEKTRARKTTECYTGWCR